MSIKWTTHSDSGILRKTEFKEKKEELFVFGYSCKLFRDDDKALHIDQGKHLIPWMGDETLKIDRYDARGALHELARFEAPPGGFDWRVELTKGEKDVEQLCDEERYRALHTNEDEEEMYKEEELKRLHAAGYGQVGFNYSETPAQPAATTQPVEVEEPFVPTPAFKALLASDIVLPETEKQNAIIEKTANFIASQGQGQGAQMEILIKAKQADNPQFQFLNRDNTLNPYYSALIALVKAGKWPEKKPEVIEEKLPENEDYLHPSLASTIIESAPSIPSIHYKPSADCDYTMLISKMRGEAPPEEAYQPELAPGEVAPPGTEPLPPRATAEISRAPVMYTRAPDLATQAAQAQAHAQAQYQQYAAYYSRHAAPAAAPPAAHPADVKPTPLKSTGLSLMKNYNTDSDSDVSDCDDTSSTDSKGPAVIQPPEDVQVVIDKMAAYVARNGAEFADIVRAKGDSRFAFLEASDVHHAYYCSRLAHMRRGETEPAKKNKAPVSFSIKKLKEPDPILPKPALPYESSDEDETEKGEKQAENEESIPKTIIPPVNTTPMIPPVVVYKIEAATDNNLPVFKTYEPPKTSMVPVTIPEIKSIKEDKPIPVVIQENPTPKVEEVAKVEVSKKDTEKTIRKSATPEKKPKRIPKESPRKDKRERDRKRDKADKEKRSGERAKRKVEKEKKKKPTKEEVENEIISLEDNSDEMIDLTGDFSDSKTDGVEAERSKQQERRRRAAEFLKKVGVDPSAAGLPTSSLASAMVDTLESLRKKKADAEEKRRKREKRRHREKYGYEDDADRSHRKSKRRKYRSSDEEDSDYDSSRKRKRRKDKKSSKNKKKKRKEPEEQVDHPLPPTINLTTTLKELRTTSPTKELVQEVEGTQPFKKDSSSEKDVNKKKKKKDREYSEGEWSSDSEDDSESSPIKNGEA